MNRRSLPYSPDLGHHLRLFALPQDRAVWLRLDQGQELFAAHPADTVQAASPLFDPVTAGANPSADGVSERLRALLARLPAGATGLPFSGGLLGYSAYSAQALADGQLPALYFGLYPQFVLIDHKLQTAELIQVAGFSGIAGFSVVADRWAAWLAAATQAGVFSGGVAAEPFQLTVPFSALTSPEKYREDFARIKQYLLAGDCYQVNYAQAFRAECAGNAAYAFQQLLALSNPAYAAWMRLPEGEVLSLSPELFLRVENGAILAKPIKGTAPRLANTVEDAAQAEALLRSEKNRSENLMIVDLLRNDISQHAVTGSVKVPALFALESLPQVHHLVSHVTGHLAEGSDSLNVLRDCFPGGSITGAPKKRAMEIIAELEPTPRSIYCGSIGFISANGDARFNIAIRTLLRQGNALYAWAGGGIVMDSECEAEYQECFHKMGALMKALEEM